MNIQGKKQLFVNLMLLQLFFSLFLAYSVLSNIVYIPLIPGFILPIIIILTSLCVWTVREMLRLADKEKEMETVLVKLEESQRLVTTMRAKHHDFRNHLQVILGLIQLQRGNEAANYIMNLSIDLVQIEKLVALDVPEVAALISAKLAGVSYINVKLDIRTSLTALNIPPQKLTSIVGNLLDNAIYETNLQSDKWLIVKIDQQQNWYAITITNPGNIPAELLAKIFEPGVSTKGDKGSGMGLYITRNLVEQYGGQLNLHCENNSVVRFEVKLPMKQPSGQNFDGIIVGH